MMDQIPDRRTHDPRILALIERVDSNVIITQKHTTEITELQRRLDKAELKQDGAIKDLNDHDGTLKVVNTFITETKMMHKSFDDFIKAQSETNKLFMEAQARSAKFQNNILLLGAAAWAVWQMFGSKLFQAAEVLVK